MKRLIFVFVISRFHFPVMSIYLRHIRAVMPRCDESLNTVREGFRCPSNQFEWEERAKQMKCETISQSCTEKNDFVYHCLLNAWPNGTIEVCAPRQIIAGSYCSEFSKGGARVQAQYRSKCKSCPFKYNSSDSFKYQECYDLVKTPEISTKQGHTERTFIIIPDTSNGEENQTITNTTDNENVRGSALQAGKYAIVFSFMGILLVVLLIAVLLCFIRRKKQKSADKSTSTEVNQLTIDKSLLKYLSKVVGKKPETLRKRILQSPFWNTYADSTPNDNQQIKVTGDFKEDLAIKAAACVLDIKIYVVFRAQDNEETIVCFFPKDPDAEKWIKISLDNNKTYRLLSDWVTCNEEAAMLTYDDEFVVNVEKDGEEIISKEDISEILD